MYYTPTEPEFEPIFTSENEPVFVQKNESIFEPTDVPIFEPEDEPEPQGPSEKQVDLLREFSAYLETVDDHPLDDSSEESSPMVGLYQLFEALTSQRHEFKLSTKSGRQTQELLQNNIETVSEAVEALKKFKKERPEIERKATTPYIASLIEIDESIRRAGNALELLSARMIRVVQNRVETAVKCYCDEMTWWTRFRQRGLLRKFTDQMQRDGTADVEQTLEPFRMGLDMLRERTDDVLRRHSLQRLNPVGQLVDPETMQVIGVVESTAVPPGHVVDVVRFGYIWRGKPLRFADVRAAR